LKDVNTLKNLLKVYSKVIEDGIRTIKWEDEIAVLKGKESLMARLQSMTLKVFSRIGVDTSSKVHIIYKLC